MPVKHTAVIPARAGSQAFPGKNRIFFDYSADFLDSVPWFDRVIVSTDDPQVKEMALNRGYEAVERPAPLAGPAVPIKSVFTHLADNSLVEPDEAMWLIFLPVLYRQREDFDRGRKIFEDEGCQSLCTFIPARAHPYYCYKQDETTGKLKQYIPNDAFRRQDLPPAWQLYHYVCILTANALPHLSNELIGDITRPWLLEEEIACNLMEADTPEEYQRWKTLRDNGIL